MSDRTSPPHPVRRYLLSALAGLAVLASLTPPRAETGAASEPGLPGPEIGLVRVDPKARNVYAYFLNSPRNLPERLHIAMTGLAHAGRIFEAAHCCLVQEQHTGVGIDSGDSFEPEPATWRLQLIWPGPPPEDIGWLGVVIPGRKPVELAKGWVGIDLENNGVTEVLFLCATIQDRDSWDKIEVYLGDPARALDEQTWHASIDFALAPGLWDCGKWKF